MSLVLLDGMEDGTAWANIWNGFGTSGARYGNCATNTFGLTPMWDWSYTEATKTDMMTIGFAFRSPNARGANNFLNFRNSGTVHMSLAALSNGDINVVFGGAGGAVRGTAVNAIAATATMYYIEFRLKVHDTTGSWELRVNGTAQASETNVDTQNGGSAQIDNVYFACQSNVSGGYQIDDLYIRNDNDFMGDIRVETLYPNGNGDVSQWVGSDGNSTDNYLLVDEAGAPNTTDYVSSATSGQQDLYQMQNLVATTGTVLGVMHAAHVQTSDFGYPKVKVVSRRAGVDSKSSARSVQQPLQGYFSSQHMLEKDPDTGLLWTMANVNALQSGVEVA